MKARPSKVEKDIAHKLYRDQKRCDEYHKLGRSQSTSVERVKVCSECFFVLWLQFKEETSAHDCYSGGAWNLSQAITQHMRPGWVQGAQLFCNVKLTWRGPNKMRCSCTFDCTLGQSRTWLCMYSPMSVQSRSGKGHFRVEKKGEKGD